MADETTLRCMKNALIFLLTECKAEEHQPKIAEFHINSAVRRTWMKRTTGLIAICLAFSSIYADQEADRLVFEGIDAYKARDYALAINKFTESIKLDPQNISAYNNRGLTYRDKGDYDASIADFTAALKIKTDWFIHYNRGIAYYQKKENDSAIADFNKAIKLNPDTPGRVSCLIGRARVNFDKQKAEPAMNDLNAALKLDSQRPDAYLLRGILYKISHQYDRSLADYEKAIALEPNEAQFYSTEAYLLSVCPMPKYRDAKKAVEYATKACELTGWNDPQSLEALAAAYAEAGQFDDAVKFQTRSVEVNPNDADQKRLALYQQKRPFRDSNRNDASKLHISDIKNKVVIKMGRSLAVHFESKGDQLINPKIVQTDARNPAKSPDCLWLEFRQDKRGRALFLWHSFRRTMRAKCIARLKDYDTYFDTDLLPVPVKTVNPEVWKERVEELVLFDFTLSGERTN